ncbi:MAG: hypothetical protein ABFD80_04360 [Acidobacteriota bacterium]
MPKPDVEQEYRSNLCDLNGFTQKGSWLTETYKPFITREVKGKVVPENIDGIWHDDLPEFEIRAMGKGTPIHRTQADKNGSFSIKNIPEGIYCFYMSCDGWEDNLGVIIVDKEADRKKTISILIHRDYH